MLNHPGVLNFFKLGNEMTDTLHIYTRVSSSVQELDGTSLDTQQELGRKKSEELGFKHKIWNEGGASSKHEDLINRPILQKLLMEVEDGKVAHLWVYNNDRLSRNSITQQTIRIALQKNKVKLYTNDGIFDLNNPTDLLMKTVLDGIAQYDNSIRTDRSRQGKLNRVRQGFWLGGPPPFGYKLKDKKLLLDPIESQWVERIYKWFADDRSTAWIKKQLDLSGVKTRRNKSSWSLGSIQKILHNTHPKGCYTYTDSKSGETVDCFCPAIISEILWDKVQNIMKKRLLRRGQVNRTKRFYLLRDLMFCGHCGKPMGGRIVPTKAEQLYYCVGKERNWKTNPPNNQDKRFRSKGCDMVRSLNISRTDALVWQNTIEILSNSSILKERAEQRFESNLDYESRLKLEQKKAKRLQKELKTVQTTIAEFHTIHLLNDMDEVISEQVRKNLEDNLKKVKNRIDQSNLKMKELGNQKYWIDAISRFETEMEKVGDFTDNQKKQFLKIFIEKIDVYFNHDTNEHKLLIRFKLPLVDDFVYDGDDESDGGDAVPGKFISEIIAPKLKTTPQSLI